MCAMKINKKRVWGSALDCCLKSVGVILLTGALPVAAATFPLEWNATYDTSVPREVEIRRWPLRRGAGGDGGLAVHGRNGREDGEGHPAEERAGTVLRHVRGPGAGRAGGQGRGAGDRGHESREARVGRRGEGRAAGRRRERVARDAVRRALDVAHASARQDHAVHRRGARPPAREAAAGVVRAARPQGELRRLRPSDHGQLDPVAVAGGLPSRGPRGRAVAVPKME